MFLCDLEAIIFLNSIFYGINIANIKLTLTWIIDRQGRGGTQKKEKHKNSIDYNFDEILIKRFSIIIIKMARRARRFMNRTG